MAVQGNTIPWGQVCFIQRRTANIDIVEQVVRVTQAIQRLVGVGARRSKQRAPGGAPERCRAFAPTSLPTKIICKKGFAASAIAANNGLAIKCK